jgi:Type IV secretion system pilin
MAGRRCRQTMRPRITRALLAVPLAAAAVLAAGALPAAAAPAGGAEAVVTSLNQVINSITVWLTGLLGALATLLATIGGVRYLLGAGDPGEVMKAKETLKYAAVGYGVAVLAPLLLTILKGFVG